VMNNSEVIGFFNNIKFLIFTEFNNRYNKS